MQRYEHTPQPAETLRETAGTPTPQKDTPNVEITIHTQEIHISNSKETIPGPHYHYESKDKKPGEAEDIENNASLYWGVATF